MTITSRMRTWLTRILLVATVAVVAVGLVVANRATPTPNASSPVVKYPGQALSFEEAEKKLKNVWKYIAIYRKEHYYLPVALRKTAEDAGIPRPTFRLIPPGNKWSLPNGVKDMQFSQEPYIDLLRGKPNWAHMLDCTTAVYADHGWSERGDKRPILMAILSDETTVRDTKNEGYSIAILRIDGTVAKAFFRRTEPLYILTQ